MIEQFIDKITHGQKDHPERFYEIFSARGFLLEFDRNAGIVRLSNDSHPEDGEFLEMLQDVNYKKAYQKLHHDSLQDAPDDRNGRKRHAFFDHINTRLFDINNARYLTELFTHEIPIDLFRLNWERDWYGKFKQFKELDSLPQVRVYDLEPFIARLIKSVSLLGISTWSSCEGHCGEPAYVKFDGRYHRMWCQALFQKFVGKKLNLACVWDWCGWDDRCSVASPSGDVLALCLEIQDVARLLYDYRCSLRDMKKQVCSRLTSHHEHMNQKELLNAFEGSIEQFLATGYTQEVHNL